MDSPPEHCLTCKKVVSARSNAITCDLCNKWNHLRCGTGITYYMYKKAIKGQYTIEWKCNTCENTETAMDTEVTSVSSTDNGSTPGTNTDNESEISPITNNELTPLRQTATITTSTPGNLTSNSNFNNSPNINDLQYSSFITVDSVPSFREADLADSLNCPGEPVADENEESSSSTVQYVVPGASSRGKDLLTPVATRMSLITPVKKTVRWRCSVRNVNTKCLAAVSFNKDTTKYTRTDKPHTCEPKVTAKQNAEVRVKVRQEAESRPFASASTIVSAAIEDHLPPEAPATSLPKATSYVGMANRLRQGNTSKRGNTEHLLQRKWEKYILSKHQEPPQDRSWIRKINVDGEFTQTRVNMLSQEDDNVLYIDAYSAEGFRLSNKMRIYGPCALFPRSILHWGVASAMDINEESLSLFCMLEPKLDILVLGVGDNDSKCDRAAITKYLMSKKINVEILSSENACAVFNFLNSERRFVAAGLIPPQRYLLTDIENYRLERGENEREYYLGTDNDPNEEK